MQQDKLPFCDYCERCIFHKEKQPCKKYSEEKRVAVEIRKRLASEEQEKLAKEKLELALELERFSTEFPRLYEILRSKFSEMNL